MAKVNKSLNRLKICCSFVELVKEVKAKSKLEKDLIELFWFKLEQNREICNNCQ